MANPNHPEPIGSPNNIAEVAQILAAGYLRRQFGRQKPADKQSRTDGGDN
ncbi:MAG: hypothetical protein M1133_16500 [Armatimonadetes bacterium]|nr:hypothetical protein [Armatimonadota bacterium]